MNTSGCSSFGIGRDDLLQMNTGKEAPCTLIIPLYIVVVTLFGCILLLVAIKRTMYIIRRSETGNYGQDSNKFGMNQIYTLTQSWLTVLNVFLLLIIPFTYGTSNSVICFLVGTLYFFFGISADRWIAKILRLGSRIIGKKPNNNTEEIYRHLDQLDWILTILVYSIRFVLLLQLSCTILTVVYPLDRYWLLSVIGFQVYLVTAAVTILMYQYQRCKNAIYASQRNIQGIVEHANRGTNAVLKKFNRHQLILIGMGLPAICIHVLWTVEVIPVNYIVVMMVVFFGAFVNSTMLFTFATKNRVKWCCCPSLTFRKQESQVEFTVTSSILIQNQQVSVPSISS